jgi:carbamoyl-phosphate synthase large subunit
MTAANPIDDRLDDGDIETVRAALGRPTPERIFQVRRALEGGIGIDEISERSGIDPWFVGQLQDLLDAEAAWAARSGREDDARERTALRTMKRLGFSDKQLALLDGTTEDQVRMRRHGLGVRPVYKTVDTCAGEFPSSTPYLYSSYDEENEAAAVGDKTVVILGSGPNRIGQGVEFDYCCVRAALEFRRLGYRTVMVNSNPETVSTDFDISDALYFEPLTLEDVLEIVALEKPLGVVVQLGGQTPLRLARGLEKAGVRILGTSPDSIDAAEDRGRFEALARELGVRQPEAGIARSVPDAVAVAARIGYPVLVRPSYVLGGRAMEIVYDDESLKRYFERAARVHRNTRF